MDEPTSNLTPEPAPRQEAGQDAGPPASPGQRGLFLLYGVMLGAAVVLLTLHFAQPAGPPLAARTPAPGGTSSPVSSSPKSISPPFQTPGQQPSNPAGTPTSPVPSGPGPAASGPEPPKGKPGVSDQPFNPFEGSVSNSMPAKQITGHIEPGPGVQINPNPGGGPDGSPVPPDQTPPKTMLVTMRLNVTDPDQALKSLQQIASKEDGAAIQFDETAKNPDPEGAILFVPSAKEQDTEKLVGAIGDLVVSDTWTGSSADRMDRIESDATNRINELHIKRQELLVKYFDDAPQIRHIDEDSDRITKCLASLRAQKPGAKTAVIKIKFID